MKKWISLSLLLVLFFTLGATFASCGNDEPREDVVKVVDVSLTDESYAFVIKKGNTDLVNDFNAYLTEIKANGTFGAIVDKYFKGVGEKVGCAVTTTDVQNDGKTFVVVTNCPFEPFEYIGDDGKIYGLDIEIALSYCTAKGLTPVIRNIGFDDIFNQVDAGYADIGMAGITVGADRALIYDFTQTYYNASQKLIVAADCTAFDGCTTVDEVEKVLAELQNARFGYQFGTTGGMYVEGDEEWGYPGFANLTGVGYDTAQSALIDLINGNLFAVVVDEAPAEALANAANR